jgi:hypothetical protein
MYNDDEDPTGPDLQVSPRLSPRSLDELGELDLEPELYELDN